jgi:hypothetical protein
MTSTKYPGWTIERHETPRRTEWTMTHASNIYAVAVYACKDGYSAELLTRQTWQGSTTWEPCRNSAEGTPREVVTEAERRVRMIKQV